MVKDRVVHVINKKGEVVEYRYARQSTGKPKGRPKLDPETKKINAVKKKVYGLTKEEREAIRAEIDLIAAKIPEPYEGDFY